MQQTEKYQLNLIDPSDDFSPEPLNQNMETVDVQLSDHDARLTNLTADVHPGAPGQIARIVTGTYVGTGVCGPDHPNRLTFDFKPILLFLRSADELNYHILMRPGPISVSVSGMYVRPTWEDRSVSWYFAGSSGSEQYQCNSKDVTYTYTVIGAAE